MVISLYFKTVILLITSFVTECISNLITLFLNTVTFYLYPDCMIPVHVLCCYSRLPIYTFRLFWCMLPSFGDNGSRDVCPFSDIMELDGTRLVLKNTFEKIYADVSLLKSYSGHSRQSTDFVVRSFTSELLSFYRTAWANQITALMEVCIYCINKDVKLPTKILGCNYKKLHILPTVYIQCMCLYLNIPSEEGH